MAIRRAAEQKFITFSEGFDDTTVVDSPAIVGTLSKALNADLVDDALIKKRNGYTKVNSGGAWGSRRITQGFEFTDSSNTKIVLIYGEDSSPTGTSGAFGKLDGTNAPTTIASSLIDGVKPSMLQFGSLAFVFNGDADFTYDGTTKRQIGITAPVSAPTSNSQIDGNLEQSSNYIFCYTYYNSTTGAESTPSPASASIATGGTGVTDGLRINITAGDSATADTIRVYRSLAGGDTLYLDGTTAIASTTYDSTVADSGLGNEMELDNSRPETCKYAIVCDNRIFIAGNSTNPNRVWYSKIGIDGPMPQSFQADDFVDCTLNDGDKIVGLSVANGQVIVLKERSVGRLSRISSPVVGLELTGSQKYIYEEISHEVTGLSHHAMTTVDNYAFWLGKDDVFGTDGSQILRFGGRIRNTIKNFNFAQATKFSAVNKKVTQQIIFSVCRSGETAPAYQIVGHYRSLPKIAWTVYSPGADSSTHPGLNAGSLFEVTDSSTGQKIVYFGSSDAVGYVYQMDNGEHDDSSGIYFDCRIPWDAYEKPAHYKLFHSYYVTVVGNGSNYNLTHTFEVENDESIITTALSSLASGTNSNWEANNWESFYWGSLIYVTAKFFPRKKAKFARYGFQNIEASQPISVKGVTSVAQLFPIHR